MRRKRFYSILLLITILGYAWVAFHLVSQQSADATLCVFKRLTTIPCPACGTSRSVLHIMDNDFRSALAINPLGYIAAFGLLVMPVWLLFDFLAKSQSLYEASEKLNSLFRNKFWGIFFIIIIVVNWVWNIYKGL